MRQHSIKTTYLIHKVLVSDEELMNMISENHVYLLIPEQDMDFPYAIIRRTGIRSESGNKDFVGDLVGFSIKIYSDEYDEAMEIADKIRFLIERHVIEDPDLQIRLDNIKMTGSVEDWQYESFMQEISFEANVSIPKSDS